MEQVPVNEDHGQCILIIDPMNLRRAQIAAFLKTWASTMGLSIIETATIVGTMQDAAQYRIAILNVGGLGVGDPDCHPDVDQVQACLPGVPLVVVSERQDAEEVVAAFNAGARGFIPSAIEPAVALQALTFILGGGSFYPPSAILDWYRLRNGGSKNGVDPEPTTDVLGCDQSRMLTGRQLEVHELLRQGKSNKMIARELNMQESTVKVHVRHIMRKLGAANRTQAALSTAPCRPAPLSTEDAGAAVPDAATRLNGESLSSSPAAAFSISGQSGTDLRN